MLNSNLNSSTRDEEPLVNAAVNRSWGKVLALGNAGNLGLLNTVRGVLDGRVGTVSVSRHSNTQADKRKTYRLMSPLGVFPAMSFCQESAHSRITSRAYLKEVNVDSSLTNKQRANSLLVLTLAREGELVLGLSVGDLVDTEPLVGGTEETRELALNILGVVELRSNRVVDINDNDLPVGLTLVKKSHHTEDLDLLDLTGVADKLTNLANIQGVVVTLGLGFVVDSVGVFPGLDGNTHMLGTFDPRPTTKQANCQHTWGKAP